jgi:hypothetical protein
VGRRDGRAAAFLMRLELLPAILVARNPPPKETAMAVNKPVGDNARKGAVKKRTQLKTKLAGQTTWTKRSKETGEFLAQKKPGTKKFKGVRREK